MKLLITGVVMVLVAIWGGSYVVISLPDNHWAEFPSFITSLLLFIFGGATTALGLTDIFSTPDTFDRGKQA